MIQWISVTIAIFCDFELLLVIDDSHLDLSIGYFMQTEISEKYFFYEGIFKKFSKKRNEKKSCKNQILDFGLITISILLLPCASNIFYKV
jgi:hypothetical protein